jgi:hypothetical protein
MDWNSPRPTKVFKAQEEEEDVCLGLSNVNEAEMAQDVSQCPTSVTIL